MKQPRLSIIVLALGLTLLAAFGAARAITATGFDLVSTNVTCLPDATGRVTVLHKEEETGVDTLRLDVSGLTPNAKFTVFLTEADAFTVPPFGAVAYIGDVTTNAAGIGSLKVDMTIAEAFVSKREGDPPARVRTDLDQVALWFADPDQVPACFHFTGSSPFDGDGAGGPAVLSSHGSTGLELFP